MTDRLTSFDQLDPGHVADQLDQLIAVGATAVQQGLAQASGGNLSVRTGPDEFRVTGKGTWLNKLRPEQFATLSMGGDVIDGPTPSSEWKLHQAIYAKRPDARAVIHVHPQFSLLLTALGKKIRFITQDHALYVGSYGQTKYYTNGSDELADTAAAELAGGRHDVVVLGNHGIAACGSSVDQAFRVALNFEEAAKLTYHALLLGDEDTIFPPDELDILRHA
ncbi:class II aldolase/adducin family protein [Nigerium massiliense]|uniref:class II aldolase/adducin family protein n=1 Tax=Nigerium massiliense TaxID=1522317 RepID=UPI0006944E5F|nr:class II aldolase/adducin family protein [Nigerium massiliense]